MKRRPAGGLSRAEEIIKMAEINGNKKSGFGLKKLIRYDWVEKNIPYFLFLSLLAVLYIYNGHYSDNTIKDINKTSRDLKEMQYEYKSLRSEVMFRSKQSELAKAVGPLGLKELTRPPVVLKDSTGN